MFMVDEQLLSPDELARIAASFRQARFLNGRSADPDAPGKMNLVADPADPLNQQASQIALAAIQRSELAQMYVMPNRIARPSAARYGPGGQVGAHTAPAIMADPGAPIRSDVSCTIFISEPDTYIGGELVCYLGSEVIALKGKAGSGVFLPSDMLHQVNPVTAGERLVMTTSIQSLVPDAQKRDLLYWLEDVRAREGLKMVWANRVRLSYVRENLIRMWAND